MAKNTALNAAGKAKNDEFYTQLSDIEKEMRHYRKHFKGKTVFCNCDDPYESNFFRYFVLNFNSLGLKKLIATCYTGSPIAGTEFSLFPEMEPEPVAKKNTKPYKAIVTKVEDTTGDGGIDLFDIQILFRTGENEIGELEGDGDFRSEESIALMDEADIVVTNPPFSLFREFVDILMEHEKKFIIIGNMNAITYKEIFPLIKENRIWLGNGFSGGNAYFRVMDTERNFAKGVFDPDTGLVKFRNCAWYTNLDIKKRHEELILVERYTSEKYPKYDNYDAIEVSKIAEIPCDYAGIMGVPITFLDKYNPDQFEILNANDYRTNEETPIKKHGLIKDKDGSINGKIVYVRILIRNKNPEPVKGERHGN